MLFFYKHKNNRKQDKQNLKQDRIAESIANKCMAIQNKASKFLERKFEMLPIGSKRLVVVAFCIISVSSCFYILLKSFSNHPYKSFSITTIILPRQAFQGGRQGMQAASVVTKEELEKIRKFRRYMDSLENSESGKRIHDSILISRPGLIDSLATVKNIIQLQSLNK